MRGTPQPDAAALNAKDHPGADDTAAICTVAANARHTWVLDWIDASYDEGGGTDDLAATLTVAFGTAPTTKWEIDIVSDSGINGGPIILSFRFPRGLHGAKGEQMVVTLSAATNIEGKLNIGYH